MQKMYKYLSILLILLSILVSACSEKKKTEPIIPIEEEINLETFWEDIKTVEYLVVFGNDITRDSNIHVEFRPLTHPLPFASLKIDGEQASIVWTSNLVDGIWMGKISQEFDVTPGRVITFELMSPGITGELVSKYEIVVPHLPEIVDTIFPPELGNDFYLNWHLSTNADFQLVYAFASINTDENGDFFTIKKEERSHLFPASLFPEASDSWETGVNNIAWKRNEAHAFMGIGHHYLLYNASSVPTASRR